MRKQSQRILSVFLTVLMCVGVMSVAGINSFAATNGYYTYDVDSNSNATITLVDSSISGNVTIPEKIGSATVTAINSFAFDGCNNITSVLIPASVKSIGSTAFYNCAKLQSISVDNSNTFFSSDSNGVLFNKAKTKLLRFPMGSTTINYSIPNTVTSVGTFSFYKCAALENVVIPESLRTIEKSAFEDCSGLKALNLPVSVSTIGFEAFNGCTALSKITVATYNQTFSSDDAGALFNKNKSTLLIFPVSSELTSYCVPATVTAIDYAAFCGNKKLETVTFASGSQLKKIDKEAFKNCASLKAVTFADDSKLETIGMSSFANCAALESVTIPASVVEVLSNAFTGCSGIKDLYVYNSACLLGSAMISASSTLTIHGYSGSTAQKYAKDNAITFVSFDGGSEEESSSKDAEESSSSTDNGSDTDSPITSIIGKFMEFLKTLIEYFKSLIMGFISSSEK